jgi:hypothetical protein
VDSIFLPFLWALNGVLAILYILAENLLTVGLLGVLIWMLLSLKPFANAYYAERIKVFLLVTTVVSLVMSVIAPSPAPFFLLVMPLFAMISLYMGLSRTNPADIFWNYAQTALIYNGAIVLFMFLENNLGQTSGTSGEMYLLQGQNYVGLMGGIAMYGIPVFFMASVAKEYLAHKPQQDPNDLLTTIRDARKPRARQ